MKSRVLIAAAAVMVVAALYWAARPPGRGRAPGNGQQAFAADFSLPDLAGHTLSLSSYRGKVVLLDFWATWCDPCREEIPSFVELQNKYRNQGLQIIGVSMDDGPEPVREFYQRFRMNYPVVMGNAKTGELYGGVLGLPIAFLIGRDGRVYSRHIGATPNSVFENDIVKLLRTGTDSSRPGPGSTGGVVAAVCCNPVSDPGRLQPRLRRGGTGLRSGRSGDKNDKKPFLVLSFGHDVLSVA